MHDESGGPRSTPLSRNSIWIITNTKQLRREIQSHTPCKLFKSTLIHLINIILNPWHWKLDFKKCLLFTSLHFPALWPYADWAVFVVPLESARRSLAVVWLVQSTANKTKKFAKIIILPLLCYQWLATFANPTELWVGLEQQKLIVFYELHYVKLDLVIYQITSFERVVELVLTSLFISVWLLSFSGT